MTQSILTIPTHGPGLYEFTKAAEHFVHNEVVDFGLLTLFCQHTSCSLIIQENADPDVLVDLKGFLERLVPYGSDASMQWLSHTAEGPDDMPAHIKAALMQTQVSVPVMNGNLALGTWQGIYLFEHRTRPHQRQVVLHLN